jgi:hypothetical protein
MNTVAFITAHAVTRYQERVDSTLTRRDALRAIREIMNDAHGRPRPRHWTKVNARPGCRYLYSATHPDICLVLREHAVVTVFSRHTCTAWNPSPGGGASCRPITPYRRPSPAAWRPWQAA